jgi:putative flavoprotein involved in K+ transport
MVELIETIIVGGGQAGLSTSYFLAQQGREHVVFERQRVGESWRSGRWDSFTLVTPNCLTNLPGFAYNGHEPNGFMPRQGVVDYLEAYAASFNAPVRTGVEVTAVDRLEDGTYRVSTGEGGYERSYIFYRCIPGSTEIRTCFRRELCW